MLVSNARHIEVRTAKATHPCQTSARLRSPLCTGKIQCLDEYVCYTLRGEVFGRERWIRDITHHCEHCALAVFPRVIVVVPEAVTA